MDYKILYDELIIKHEKIKSIYDKYELYNIECFKCPSCHIWKSYKSEFVFECCICAKDICM